MSKHTPGPWEWKEPGPEDMYGMPRLVGKGEVVMGFGTCGAYYPTEGEPPEPADRALIASAPDLLEALEKAVASYDSDRRWRSARGGDADYPDAEWVTEARAAIARAKGEQGE